MILSGRHQRGTPHWKRCQQEEALFGHASRLRVDMRGPRTRVRDLARSALPSPAKLPAKEQYGASRRSPVAGPSHSHLGASG